jgi:hypothetical protein
VGTLLKCGKIHTLFPVENTLMSHAISDKYVVVLGVLFKGGGRMYRGCRPTLNTACVKQKTSENYILYQQNVIYYICSMSADCDLAMVKTTMGSSSGYSAISMTHQH